jgi:hypothetical protein
LEIPLDIQLRKWNEVYQINKKSQSDHIKNITILKLTAIHTTSLNNTYLEAKVVIVFNDNSTIKTGFSMNFDKAIESGELSVPDQYKNQNGKLSVADEIAKLNKLYQDSIITKEEFEAGKKKLLSQN